MSSFNSPLLRKRVKSSTIKSKVALDALLEMYNDSDYAEHQHHSDPDFTTQNGKDYAGRGSTEVEEGALSSSIPGSLLASQNKKCWFIDCHASAIRMFKNANFSVPVPMCSKHLRQIRIAGKLNQRCVACEGGDCFTHGYNEEPTVQDATFFKEGEDFEVTRTASGKIIIQSDTKSYGMGTPNGGTPSTPQPTQNNPNTPSPPPPNQIPEVKSQSKTPQQLHDEAQNSPTESGNLTQQQLQQVLEALKTSAVPIKDAPTMLPPRDDIRRHIDEDAQDEVMEGVHEPTRPQPSQESSTPPPIQQEDTTQAPTAQQELLRRALANSQKKAWFADDDDDDDDDENNGQYGTMYGKPLRNSETGSIKDRLEYLRSQLRAESISYSELAELESLAEYIEPDDVELLEAAGVPEHNEEETPTAPKRRFRPTKKDKDFLKSMRIKAKKAAQTEELVNQVCPSCHGQNFNKLDSEQEDGSLVECLNCGCFFAV